MTYDAWKTRTPDDDPDGEHQDEKDRCTSCGAYAGEECEPVCGCARCRTKECAQQDAPPKDAA